MRIQLSYKPLCGLALSMLLTLAGQSSLAGKNCSFVYEAQKISDEAPFRQGKTEYDSFRANAFDYWKWSHDNMHSYFPKNLLTEGLIAGDPHAMNFGDLYLSGQKTKITLVDLDDSGHGAFLVDFSRLLLSIKMSSSELKAKKIWKAYLQGLRQEAFDEVPDFVQEVMDKTRDEWLDEQEHYVDKNTSQGRMDKDRLELKPLSKLSSKNLARAKALQAKVAEFLPGAKLEDTAFKVKEDGGSQGMLRVWVLIKQNGREMIYEFKEMAAPATQYFESQKAHKQRLEEVTSMFWGVADPAEYKVVTLDDGSSFWLRPRYKYGLKFNSDKIETDNKFEKYEEWNEYIAYLLGRLHGKQTSAAELRSTLKNLETDQVLESIKTFTKAYRDHMDELSN